MLCLRFFNYIHTLLGPFLEGHGRGLCAVFFGEGAHWLSVMLHDDGESLG